MEKFNKKDYDNNYRKIHYKQFKADLKLEEFKELEELLKKYNLTKIQFLRNAIIALKNKNI